MFPRSGGTISNFDPVLGTLSYKGEYKTKEDSGLLITVQRNPRGQNFDNIVYDVEFSLSVSDI